MKNVSFFSKAICLFLFTMFLMNCSSTEINEDLDVESLESIEENIDITDEEEIPLQKIDKGDIKPPSQG